MTDSIPPIGIDLGTTNSVIGTAMGGDFHLLENQRGDHTTPSVVSYDDDTGSIFVGQQALNRAITHPTDTVESIKRYIGSEEQFQLGPETYRPEEVSALILKKLVRDAEEQLSQPVQNAVITVPAYFSESQRKATKTAGEIAGLNVDRIITEPTAACLAYGLQETVESTVFVYDLGGGTFDCSVVDIADGIMEVQGVDGHTELGGDDFDGLIVNWILDEVAKEHGSEPEIDSPKVESLVFKAARTAKHDLTSRQKATINLPYLNLKNGESVNVELTLTREILEQLITGPVEETLSISQAFLDDIGLTTSEIDDVLLIGGSTRIPYIQNKVAEEFGREPRTGISPDHIVALGATTQSCLIHDKPIPSDSSTNIVPSIQSNDQSILVNEDGEGNKSGPVLIDTLPQTIGIKLVDRDTDEPYFQPLLSKGEELPAKAEIETIPIDENQTHSVISVYQGVGKTLAQNEQIDEFTLGPYPPKSEGKREHLVRINVDRDGIIYLEAIDEDYGIREDIEIETEFALSDDEITELQSELPALHK